MDNKILEKINYRFDIINQLIEKNNYESYLEIGVKDPTKCFDLVNCKLKHGVDPMVEEDHPVTFKVTSDEFFSTNTMKYDIIFIDGLHLDYQVERDIINGLNVLNDNGIIVLHDCNPVDVYHQREDFYDVSTPAHLGWNGTVWKAIVRVRSERDDIYTSVVDMDHGIGLIQKSKNGNKIINDNCYYSYNKFLEKKQYYLNLISKSDFYLKYILDNSNEKKNLTWLAKFDDYSSMGILSQRILETLNNVDISCKTIIGDSTTNNQLIKNLLKKNINSDLGIMFSYPDQYQELNLFKTKVIYTGVDTTGGIANFAENANKVDFLLTPSKKSKDMMIGLGVKKPIFVFPHGIDPQVFKFKEREVSDKFKFLYVGECSDRKGIFQLFEAFIGLFGNNPNVELHIKSNLDMVFYNGENINAIKQKYTNIFWHVSNEGHDEVIKLYNECHAYVYPSRADTFGMTIFEAMACGLPVISTNEPGVTEFVKGKYFEVKSKLVPVKEHPWMLGKWGQPDVESLKKQMKHVYTKYKEIVDSGNLKEYSEYIRDNFSWEKVVEKFDREVLPSLHKKDKILTLLTSFNRPHHISNVIDSLKSIREDNVDNYVYIVENSNYENKNSVINVIKSKIDDKFKLYDSDFNLGQRGALLQMLDDVNIDDYDFIQFTDQDNVFNEPLSTYCSILRENPDIFFVTGYMSKEHKENGWRNTKYGKLCEKSSCRAGHMFLRKDDLKSLFPIHLDSQYGEAHNSSWYAGLDWELQWWNPRSPGKLGKNNFVLCVPNGVLHKGIDSTFYEWPVEENEYTSQELIEIRY